MVLGNDLHYKVPCVGDGDLKRWRGGLGGGESPATARPPRPPPRKLGLTRWRGLRSFCNKGCWLWCAICLENWLHIKVGVLGSGSTVTNYNWVANIIRNHQQRSRPHARGEGTSHQWASWRPRPVWWGPPETHQNQNLGLSNQWSERCPPHVSGPHPQVTSRPPAPWSWHPWGWRSSWAKKIQKSRVYISNADQVSAVGSVVV